MSGSAIPAGLLAALIDVGVVSESQVVRAMAYAVAEKITDVQALIALGYTTGAAIVEGIERIRTAGASPGRAAGMARDAARMSTSQILPGGTRRK